MVNSTNEMSCHDFDKFHMTIAIISHNSMPCPRPRPRPPPYPSLSLLMAMI